MFFDGSSGFVALGDAGTIQPSQQVSVEAWIRTRAAGAAASIVRKRLYGYELFLGADGVANFSILDANAMEYTARGNPVTDGVWHHLVGTYDGSNVCMYVDGERRGCAAAGKIYYQPDLVAIGRDGGFNGSYFNGSIDEVAIYGAALSPAQVQSHFAAAH
jgi:Concanavalin A-like lectin/glucanases superfamily